MPDAAPGLFTIGHSNAALGDVLDLLQQHGIQAVADVRTVPRSLLCSEEDPSRCHRHLLIGRVLRDRGVPVSHIRHDGRIETEAEVAARELSGTPQDTLFGSRPVEDQWKSPPPRPRKRPPGRAPAR